ncbi:MAG: O-antigen ligase family protein [Planctomycetota bacterium]
MLLLAWALIRCPTPQALVGVGLLGGLLLLWVSCRSSASQDRLVVAVLWHGAACALVLGATLTVGASQFLAPNLGGALLSVYAFFPAALLVRPGTPWQRRLALVAMVAAFGGVIASGSRASLLSLSASLTLGLVALKPFRPRWNMVISALVIAGVAVPVAYLVLLDPHWISDQFSRVEPASIVLGKRLNSGREQIWPVLADAIHGEPWLGRGTRANPGLYYAGRSRSAHNGLLQAWYQWGLVGFGLVIALYCQVARALGSRQTELGCCALGFFLGFAIRDCFEVTLFENVLLVAIPSWVVLGLGFAQPVNRRELGGRATRRQRRERLPHNPPVRV